MCVWMPGKGSRTQFFVNVLLIYGRCGAADNTVEPNQTIQVLEQLWKVNIVGMLGGHR